MSEQPTHLLPWTDTAVTMLFKISQIQKLKHKHFNAVRDQTVSDHDELSDETRIQRRDRQGCVAYPTLFNLYTEKIFRHNLLSIWRVSTWGHKLQQFRYADDTALLAGNEKELSDLTSKINEVGKQFGMKINIKKTKAMVVSKKPNSPKINIAINGEQIEQVTSYSVSWELNNWGWEIRKGDQEKNNDTTDHIHQHENTTIVSRHKPEDPIKSNKMLYLANTILWSRDMDNYKISLVQTRCIWDVGLSQSFENIMDGKDY